MDITFVREKYHKFGQDHVLQHWAELDAKAQNKFLKQLSSVDLEELHKIFLQVQGEQNLFENATINSAPVQSIAKSVDELAKEREAFEIGEEAIRSGKTAAFVVAGGQGSRLGFDGPKGCFDIALPSGRSLFEIQANQIQATANYYQVDIPWYVMTSEANHADTVSFFQKHQYFGLRPDLVSFFSQDMLPAVDQKGKLILTAKDELFMSPNGHGGSLLALKNSGALADMRKRGVLYLSYYQVDNPIVDIIDPLFVGSHIMANSEMSFKLVAKRDASEKVGVVAEVGGKLQVIEYSDLPESEMTAKTADGRLKFWAGSVAIHLFDVSFIERITASGLQLPWHKAEKSIPYLNQKGALVTPKEKNGIKFESFVFDAVGLAKKVLLLEVAREDQFGPVKNKSGEDSPETARQMYLDKCSKLYKKALKIADGKLQDRVVEINPLYAYSGKVLAEKLKTLNFQFSGEYLS